MEGKVIFGNIEPIRTFVFFFFSFDAWVLFFTVTWPKRSVDLKRMYIRLRYGSRRARIVAFLFLISRHFSSFFPLNVLMLLYKEKWLFRQRRKTARQFFRRPYPLRKECASFLFFVRLSKADNSFLALVPSQITPTRQHFVWSSEP